MKFAFRFLPAFLIVASLLYACSDDEVTEKGPVDPDPFTPDLTVKVQSSVSGFVIDEDDAPVAFAEVAAGNKTAQTDEFGYFKIEDVSVSEFADRVKVTRVGFFQGYATIQPVEDEGSVVRIKMLTKTEAGAIEAMAGGTVSTTDGGSVMLSSNGVVVAGTTNEYSGTIHVSIRPITSSNDIVINGKPGDARGVNADGHATVLKSFSTVAVELTGNSGEALQLMNGKPTTVKLPIPDALASEAPATISLWYYNTDNGLWQEEGTATKEGNVYVGTVNHFSFWDGAIGMPMVNFTARIVNASNAPLANVPVSVRSAGTPRYAGHERLGFTDANGVVGGAVFANANLVLDILTPCATSVYAHEFSTAASDLDLGTLTGNLGQSLVTLTGTVVDCESQPVVDGYLQTYDFGFYNRIPIVNGTFSFTGITCTNRDVNFVVVNNDTYQQNEPVSISLATGANDLGQLSACGLSTVGSITYTIDGNTTTIAEPDDDVAAYNLHPTSDTRTQVVALTNPNNEQTMAFQFEGEAAPGGTHTMTEVFSLAFPSGRGYWPAPIAVTITEYGPIGGFISGEFSSNMLDFESNELHTLSVSFRVRRMN